MVYVPTFLPICIDVYHDRTLMCDVSEIHCLFRNLYQSPQWGEHINRNSTFVYTYLHIHERVVLIEVES